MANNPSHPGLPEREVWEAAPKGLPLPTQRFRRLAWLAFQRALDPLAPPRPMPPTRKPPDRDPTLPRRGG